MPLTYSTARSISIPTRTCLWAVLGEHDEAKPIFRERSRATP
jgi:hypothetical protein